MGWTNIPSRGGGGGREFFCSCLMIQMPGQALLCRSLVAWHCTVYGPMLHHVGDSWLLCDFSFFSHHQALYGPMATWLEFPYECSPRELEVVRIVCPLCAITNLTYSVCFLWKHAIYKMPTDQTGKLGTNKSHASNP